MPDVLATRRFLSLLFEEVTAANRNFRSVDFLRGIAALAVVIFHFKNFGGGGGDMARTAADFDHLVLLQWLDPVRQHGALAVMAFWVISGFVFMNIYAGAKPDGGIFFVRRFARLYPLHLLTLLVIALIQAAAVSILGFSLIYHDNNAWNFLLHLFMASEWGLEQGLSFNYPIWSVSAEIAIYFIFWAIVRHLPLNLVRLFLIWLAFEGLAIVAGSNMIVLCGAYFFGGALTYAVYRLWPSERRGMLLVFAAAALALSIVLAVIRSFLPVPLTAWLLPAIGATLLILTSAEDRRLGAFFKRTRAVGDITYSSYLWHSPLQMLILFGAALGFWSVDSLLTDGFFILYLVLVCLVAFASFRWVERPAQSWILATFDPAFQRKPLIAAP